MADNEAMAKAQIPAKAIENLWNRIERGMEQWQELIAGSFLSEENKSTLKTVIENRAKELELKSSL